MSDSIPYSTLFLLSSVDGKISSGAGDERGFEQDLPAMRGVGWGLPQYHAMETQSEQYSLSTGRVLAKLGWNGEKDDVSPGPLTQLVLDNRPHLTEQGVRNLLRRNYRLIILTGERAHPALALKHPRLEVWLCGKNPDLPELFQRLRRRGIERLTVQSGGQLNAALLRAGLIQELSLVLAPLLVGGRETPSLIGGSSLALETELRELQALTLLEAQVLKGSYLHLRYRVGLDPASEGLEPCLRRETPCLLPPEEDPPGLPAFD